MAFCKSCGAELGTAAFCPKCGANQNAPVTPGVTSSDSPTSGMDENVAGLLCYLFGWLSGLIFLLIDKRPFVRFHGAQSIAFNLSVGVVAIVFWIAVAILTFLTAAILHMPFGFLAIFLWPVIGIAFVGTWIFLMYKAYQHEKFKLPIIGNMVEKMVG
jgi:uncharacterized membrane protein